MLLVTTVSTNIAGEQYFKPCIQFNGQVWVEETQYYRDEDIAYKQGVKIATEVNALVRAKLREHQFAQRT